MKRSKPRFMVEVIERTSSKTIMRIVIVLLVKDKILGDCKSKTLEDYNNRALVGCNNKTPVDYNNSSISSRGKNNAEKVENNRDRV